MRELFTKHCSLLTVPPYLCPTNHHPLGVSEWSKEHAWKVCMAQKVIVGSNPTPSTKSPFLNKKRAFFMP